MDEERAKAGGDEDWLRGKDIRTPMRTRRSWKRVLRENRRRDFLQERQGIADNRTCKDVKRETRNEIRCLQ